MSKVTRKVRHLERHRAKVLGKRVPEIQGKGKAESLEAKKINMRTELARKKVSGKAVREFDGKDAAGLQTELADARKELFNLRFRHATGQLQEVADLAATRRRIARLLTLIRQKEVGA